MIALKARHSEGIKGAARVFISYSRSDGAGIAHQLRDRLARHGVRAWLDTDQIGGGASWSDAVESALNDCDVLLAVLTDGSHQSGICRAEQIWALDTGKRVIPVLATANAPRPIHLYGLNYRKFPEQAHDVLADIEASPDLAPPPRRPLRYDTVPDPPQNFLARAQAVQSLRDLLLTEEEPAHIAVTAVAGMGGIGKTVLAAALCQDAAVQRAFPDGIAWITVGRDWNGDFSSRMREVAKALGDTLDEELSAAVLQKRYRELLSGKSALVVLDDVWNLEHLQSLLVKAPRARFLFTTRDGGIARAVTDRRYQADLLNEKEGLELLAGSAGVTARQLPPEASGILKECNGLALAVAQMGGSLRDLPLATWRDTLTALEQADISAIEDLLPTGQKSFFNSLTVSIKALPAEKQDHYLKLAALLEDVPAPLPVLRTLWGLKEDDARRNSRYFVERSLANWESLDNPAAGIRLHDLQLDYVRARYPARAALPLIHEATRLSAHVIEREPEQYASQLTGRLLSRGGVSGVLSFLEGIVNGAPRPWLRPLRPALHPPGTSLLRTLEGHSGWVTSVALTADGKRAVSASHDHTLKVWDLETGHVLRTLEGHSRSVTSVALTADGKRAVSASYDETLKVWELETGRLLRTLERHSGWVTSVALTADGKRAVSASYDETLKVWELETGRLLRTLERHRGPVTSVALTADGKRAVSASWDETLKVWDLETGRLLRTLERHRGPVTSVALTADGKRAVSASWDETLKVWDLETGRLLRTLEGHWGPVESVALTADGKRAVSASWDETLKVWDLETAAEVTGLLRTLEGHSDRVNCVALTADGKRAVSASWDETLKVWNLETAAEVTGLLRTLEGHSDWVTSVALTADGKRAVSASRDETLKVWNLETGRGLRTLEGQLGTVASVALTADGKRAVSASWDNTLKVWDLETGRGLRTLEGHSDWVTSVALTADGKRAVSASRDETLKVWNLETGRGLRTLEGHSDTVTSVALTADGKRAISASGDNTLKVWNLETGRVLRTLEGHSDIVNGVALTADGKRAVSASHDHTLKVWNLETAAEVTGLLHTLEGHLRWVASVALTADGKRAISASHDNTLKVWELETGFLTATFNCDAGVRCCAFDPPVIAAGDATGQVHLLRLEENAPEFR